jgi:hypothetical protein
LKVDRAKLLQIIETMGSHIADGARMLAQQRELIRELKDNGVDVTDVEVRVFWFQYRHARLISRKAVLEHLLVSVSPPDGLDPDLIRLIWPNADKVERTEGIAMSSDTENHATAGPPEASNAARVARDDEISRKLERLLQWLEDGREQASE